MATAIRRGLRHTGDEGARASVAGVDNDRVMTKIDGWVAPGFEAVREVFQTNFDSGAEDGAAFAAYHRGHKVVDLWGGVADTTTGRPWVEDTMVLTYSTTKGATAMCANRLAEQGLLDVDAPVVRYWPEFAQGGKDAVTVADLLAHRAGLAWIDGTMSFEEALAWDPVVEALARQIPAWEPGHRPRLPRRHLRLPGGRGGASDQRSDPRHLLPVRRSPVHSEQTGTSAFPPPWSHGWRDSCLSRPVPTGTCSMGSAAWVTVPKRIREWPICWPSWLRTSAVTGH